MKLLNLLKFISVDDINTIGSVLSMPCVFKMIELNTADMKCAVDLCNDFFVISREIGGNLYYYTESSDYQFFGGWSYQLKKDFKGYFWLVLSSNERIEI